MERQIYLSNFPEEKIKPCMQCPARGETLAAVIIPICKIARLENQLGKIPTYEEISANNIQIDTPPEGCPNGYISFPPKTE